MCCLNLRIFCCFSFRLFSLSILLRCGRGCGGFAFLFFSLTLSICVILFVREMGVILGLISRCCILDLEPIQTALDLIISNPSAFISSLLQQFHPQKEQIHAEAHITILRGPKYQFDSHNPDQKSSRVPYTNKSHKRSSFFLGYPEPPTQNHKSLYYSHGLVINSLVSGLCAYNYCREGTRLQREFVQKILMLLLMGMIALCFGSKIGCHSRHIPSPYIVCFLIGTYPIT